MMLLLVPSVGLLTMFDRKDLLAISGNDSCKCMTMEKESRSSTNQRWKKKAGLVQINDGRRKQV